MVDRGAACDRFLDERRRHDRFEVNGTGYAAPAGSSGRDGRAEGTYLNGSYAGEPLPDEPRVNGSLGVHGPFDDEPPVGLPAHQLESEPDDFSHRRSREQPGASGSALSIPVERVTVGTDYGA